jgi:hypothetical protein
LRLTTRQAPRCAARLTLLIFFACVPAFAQTVPPEPDPLSRIRAQPPAQACSATEVTLCDEAAPKIFANATGNSSTIEANLREFVSGEGGHAMGAPASPTEVSRTRAVDWAVAAFRAAGLDVHAEYYNKPPDDSGSAAEQVNVVAEIRGREKPDEIVILGTDLNFSDMALYDASNAAVLIEAARDIRATGLVPRRTIRFVLFSDSLGDGPQGLPGSLVYIRAHRNEMDRTIADINFSGSMGAVTGYSLGGRHDIESGVDEAVKPIGEMVGVVDTYDGSGDFDFLLEGVPNLVATGEFRKMAEDVSNGVDTAQILAKMNFLELRHNAAIAGVTAFDVAEDVAPLGPRLSRAEIGALLKQAGLDSWMKTIGVWPEWENGQRGRQP